MQLRARHRFSVDPDALATGMVNPDFVHRLIELPNVGSVDVVDHGADADQRWLTARLSYDGDLDPVAAKILGSTNPSWLQTYRILANGTGRLEIAPERHAGLLDCHATITLRPATDGGTERILDGSLRVKVPLIGGRAERAMTPAILARIDIEAALLDTWLTSR